ncbi:MAG: ribonuclease Y [Candidatus Omnitrophica bacterium]|nr:ribonuclease Y [Candidatus Omnitrophota bacterium]MBU4478169.1 ribonuclease Y [Candidatus Omnitrophota bacterium]MCG2703669.1 ribonuclease Y [Candidatus Omnitrophota bacterium]
MNIIIWVTSVLVFFWAGYFFRLLGAEKKVKSAEARAKTILDEAEHQAQTKKKEAALEAKDLLYKTRLDFEKESKGRRQELLNLERRLIGREENLDRKVDLLEKKERELSLKAKTSSEKEQANEGRANELNALILEEKERLQRVSGLSSEEAKKILLKHMEDEVRYDANLMIKKIEEEAKETADKKAKQLISLAIQRCAAEHTVESTVSVVSLPSDDMKGRIIGREGRNIRALEVATGIDVIIDDTPEAVTLSGFDPIRREIARLSLERLITNGRIHPARIEEVVEKVKKEMEQSLKEEGEKAVFDIGIQRIHPEIVKLLGRLKYRTSYGQNVLQHSREVSFIMGLLAGELQLDIALAKRIGLLHDIGKAVDHEVEGTHAGIGAELARKYGEAEPIVNALAAHHDEVESSSIYGVLVQAADAISATRPGARRETLEIYVKRLAKLEAIADSFKGVDKAFAIQAGREIRVVVHPDKVGDAEAAVMAREITKKIESELEYPGQVKVTVIREKRIVEYAK